MRALFTLYFSRLCRRCFGCFSRTGSPRHLERVAFQICPPANERSGIRLRPCGCASSFSKVNRSLCAERTCSVPKWRYTVLRDVSLTGYKQIIVPEGNSACCPFIYRLIINYISTVHGSTVQCKDMCNESISVRICHSLYVGLYSDDANSISQIMT